MVKNLLFLPIWIVFFFLAPMEGVGQCVIPTVTIQNVSGSSVCEDETISFNGSVTSSSSDILSYQWQVSYNNGAYTDIAGATNEDLSGYDAAIGSNRFKLLVTYNCTENQVSQAVLSQPSSTVTVLEKRTGSVTMTASNTNICPGENVTFNTTAPANLGASPDYDWQLTRNENTTSISSLKTFTIGSLVAGDVVRLYVTSSVPCVDPVYSTNTFTITEKPGIPSTPGAFTSGEAEVCPELTKTYTVPNDNTASEYIWTLPSGWTGSSNNNTITVTTGNSGGSITVKAKNSCGTSEARTLGVSVKAGIPAQPAAISGTAAVCPGIAQTFSVTNVSSVSYTWQIPAGWDGTSTTNSITLTPSTTAQNGNLSVTATNDCGTSSARTLALSVKPGIPAQPLVFTAGSATLCPGTQGTYKVPGVTGATNYIWTLPSGFSATNLTTTTPSLVVTAGTSGSGNITVKASNDCGTGEERIFAVAINDPVPVMNENIQGSPAVCAGTQGLTYSIPLITNATSYEWSASSGWAVTAGQGSNSITLTSGTSAGTISVKAINSCGESASRNLLINLNPPPPAIPGAITFSDGTDKACSNTAETYSFAAVPNASSYLWTLPNGSTQSTTVPSLSFTATASGTQTLKVAAVNSCGTSNEKSFQINVAGGKPAKPETITASKYTVCPPETGFLLSVPEVSNADSYQWFLPAGWEITNGAGTNAITVKINASSTYQNPTVVGVEAKNHCGNSTRQTTSSNINDANAIAVSDFVFVDLGEDRVLCNSNSPVTINAALNFGGKKLKIASIKSSSGVTINDLGNGAVDSHTFSYPPTLTDLNNGSVTITMITANPGGACNAGKDEMTIFFRPTPTSTIATPDPICAGSSTSLTFTGTPNTRLTYRIGTGSDKTIDIGATGTAILNTGALNSNTTYNLRSIQYLDTPSCSNPLSGSATVTVTPKPTATISYSTPFCTSPGSTESVTLNTTGTVTGAQFSAPSGLTINPTTGAITPSSSTPGSYTVTYTVPALGGCDVVVATTEVEIFEKVVITTPPTGDRICEGENVQFEVSATGDDLTYQWYKGTPGSGTAVNGGTSDLLNLNSAPTSDAGDYFVEITGASPCEMVRSSAVNLQVDSTISITEQPIDTEVCVGDTVNLSVTASAGNETLNYQWYKGTPGSGTAIGSTNLTGELEISGTTTASGGDYYVMIIGTTGYRCEPVISEAATLTVREIPSITITGSAEICDGLSADISFAGTPNTAVTYTINGGNSQTIALDASGEATLSTGALSVVNNDITDYEYTVSSVQYSNGSPCAATVTGSATITVNPTPDVNVSFENSQVTFCNDTFQGTFTPSLTGSGAFTGGVFSAEGLNVNEETGAFTPANATAGDYKLNYYLEEAGGCSELAATLDITIFTSVEITSEPFPVAVCTANDTQLEIAASGDNLSYQWFKVVATSDSEVGADSPILELNNATATTAGDYYVVVSGDNACEPAISETVTVTVDENIEVTQQPNDQDACIESNVTLTVDAIASGSNENIQYRWMFRSANSNNVNDWTYVSGGETATLILSEVNLSQAGQYRAEIDGPDFYSCSIGYSEIAVVTVYEQPTADAGVATLEVCSTTNPISLGIGANVTNHSSVQWTTSNGHGAIINPGDLNGVTYIPAEADYGETLEFSLTAILEVDGVELCAETIASDVKVITIIPQPAITGFSYTDQITNTQSEYCETDMLEQSPDITGNFLTGGEGEFSVAFSGNPTNPLVVNAASGVFTPNGTNPGTYVITYTYSAASQTGVCNNASAEFSVVIGEKPVAEFTYGDNPFCSDAANPLPVSLNEGILGTFTSDEGLVFLEGGEPGQIDLNASTPGTYTVINTVDYEGDGCQPVQFEANITINAKPAAPQIADLKYCLNEEDVAGFVANPAEGGEINWYTSVDSSIEMESAPVVNTAVATTTPFWASQTSAEGCESERVEVTITINALPEVSISVDENLTVSDDGNPVICFGSNIILTGNGAAGYSWSTESENLGVGSTMAVSPEVTTTYYALGIDGNECSNTAEVTVEVSPTTEAGIIDAPASVCADNPAGILELSGYTGEIMIWEYQTSGENSWNLLNSGSIDATQSFSGLTGTTTFRATIKSGVCIEKTTEKTVTVDPLPFGGELAFADIVTTDYNGRIFTICEGASTGYSSLSLNEHAGNIIAWKYRINGGAWTTVSENNSPFTGSSLTGAQIQALNLTQTTVFRVEIASGACTPNVFSQTAILSIIPTDIEPQPVTVSKDVVCLGEEVILSSETGYSSSIPIVEGGAFDNAGIKNHGWRFLRPNGTAFNFETNANNVNPDVWSRATPRDFPTAGLTSPYTRTNQRWDSGVEDGNKGFAIVSGTNSSSMETSVFGIGSMDQAIMTFDQAYNLTPGASISVEISTNGGASYDTVLFSRSGATASGNPSNFGTGSPESRPDNKIVVDLGNYLGQNNLRIRFNYTGARAGDIWAVDAVNVPEGPRNVSIEWNDYTNPEQIIQIGTTNSVTYAPKQIGLNVFEVKTSLIFDSTGNACDVAENSENIEVFVFDKYTTSTTAEYGSCGVFEAKLTAKILNGSGIEISTVANGEIVPTPDGYVGEWKIEGPAGYQLVDPNPADNVPAANEPLATLTTNSTGTYKVSWSLVPTARNLAGELYTNPEACPPVETQSDVIIVGCTALDFDGLNDRVLIDHTYPGVMSFEAWIRPKENGGTIISGPNFRITTPADVVPNSRWYHIAVSNGKLYIDGIKRSDLTLGNSAGTKTVIGAEIINGEATNFFHGWIEEVRLWKRALTVDQIRFMMNQRLINNGAQMGEQIPMNVPGGLTYADLAGYYRLISANPDPAGLVAFDGALMPLNGETPNLANAAIPGRLVNMETNQENTAPLPYFSANPKVWANDDTWARPEVWDPPHTGPIEWNIANISHNINSGSKDITVLGLLSDSGELTIANPSGAENENNSGQFLNITHYLLLNGNIDLVGESQLLQGEVGILDESSAGWLERDQQGTRSSFNYNYWSSPVSLQGEANNSTYTIAQVLRDGTDSNNPQIINFRPGHNAADNARTNAVTVSEYWLWRFNGTSDVYEEWIHIGSSGTLRTGEGFTMKGTDGNADIETRQNYVFIGKPHNGDFTLPVGMDKNYLIGNPYPSAIDAREFILDNLNGDDVIGARNTRNVFNGVVYFWDHFAGHTHILREYVGGYAALTLAGAVPAVSIDERINANEESGTKTPQQYIPVGQGFFINTGLEITSEGEAGNAISVDAGNIEFKNSQREAVRETPDNSIFLKPIYPSKKATKAQDERAKIRLRFDSPKGYHRQILVAADPITTDNVDLGYDAPLIEYNLDDMYWIINQREYIIQAVPDFGKERILPLGVQLEEKGNFTIAIDSRENLGEDHKIYLQDKLRDSIHDFKDGPYKEESESGFIDDRFSIIFHKKEVPVPGNGEAEEEEEESIFDAITIAFKHSSRELKVYNPDLINISHVILFDLTGKKIQEFGDIATEKEVTLPVVQFPSSVYIVKLFSDKRTHNKKILMK
ncbi:LamG-like jellyroll fold domain-containing protein [Autumnicola psychrophila]|uniref:LamG-like jellyroll fold domain-containing protein n=1 Tax=Autumnicola psychrophila TaxID=3075592 RepID=A0ABU3DMI9_9FLAO|nr:LamG-like jellyroll fold domain-containing protein [Zunongwangia sp. F225]MDT0684934.1 LamG-like jellyroll fold domain-containing protein [Zunongwangia sp. F225]